MSAENLSANDSQSLFDLANRVVEHTNRHLFLTGKAGTGKTTFLKHIQQHTHKKTVVAAPTGVAAMNAGGMTLHSLFQLPMGAYLADARFDEMQSGAQITNRQTLFRNLRFSTERKQLLQALDLLIIDEVSMLRADMLDAVDAILRYVRRRNSEPFGGVQVLFIGDLFQLPPVLTNEEAPLFYEHYRSPFFFHARVMQEARPLVIELRKVYRQQDERFISLLNAVRNNQMGPQERQLLNDRYFPNHEPEEGVILLTTHNARADQVNYRRLEALRGRTHQFEGVMSGTFNERNVPVDPKLMLKVGAQIMFVKNDVGEVRRYYNGLIGTISHIGEDDDIWVQLPEKDSKPLKLELHTWKNVRYKYNEDKESIDEEELGSYQQFPIRLAWAITIHKSQGLSFDKAVVDAGASFTAGQVYVALSRLRSLEGLILHTQIAQQGIQMPEEILEFYRQQMNDSELNLLVESEQRQALLYKLQRWFSMNDLLRDWDEHEKKWEGKNDQKRKDAIIWWSDCRLALLQLQETGRKFSQQLDVLFRGPSAQLAARVLAAEDWFRKELMSKVCDSFALNYAANLKQKTTKKLLEEWKSLEAPLQHCLRGWRQAVALTDQLAQGKTVNEINLDLPLDPLLTNSVGKPEAPGKPEKVDTFQCTLSMFQEGKTIAEIAAERGLVNSTIEGHLVKAVEKGQLSITELFSEEQISIVRVEWEKAGIESSAKVVFDALGGAMGYHIIHAVKAQMQTAMGNQQPAISS
jgi:nucleoside-triphosphatase THEP1